MILYSSLPANAKTSIKNAFRFTFDDKARFMMLRDKGKLDHMDDEKYLRRLFRCEMGYKLNLNDPVSFNEKLQWLKLHDRNPIYHVLVDKIAVKQWAAERIGEDHIIPTLGVWDDPDEINFDSLPDKFVLKCNHNSGLGMYICSGKSDIDVDKVRTELKEGLKQDYYKPFREWAYKDIPRKVLAEEHLGVEDPNRLVDYKVFCFDGIPKLVEIDWNRFVSHKTNVYTTDWELMDVKIGYPSDKNSFLTKPLMLEELLQTAAKLSGGFPFVRVDCYIVGEHVYFGEMTLYPGAGFSEIKPKEFEIELGNYLTLPK